MKPRIWKLNTSNKGKLDEFKQLFAKHGAELEATQVDLKEIDADHVTVVTHKASQLGDNIIVEDTSLEVEGADIGTNIRWLLDHLNNYIGHKAVWTVLLALRQGNEILIYKATVAGKIVASKGSAGFGFDPVFQPDGSSQTLAESKPEKFNARAKAVTALLEGSPWLTQPILKDWNGPWQ